MARIAIGGWHHETNTFAPIKADYAAFEQADAWPALTRGQALIEKLAPVHLPIAGAIERLRDHELVALSWCSATPSAQVTEAAFERIAAMLLEDLQAALPLDGVYLDLHGAMVAEHVEDGEGELLARVREVLGPDLPLSISLDLHANLTPAMVRHASAIDIYRTYPHVDMADTGARAAGHLLALLESGRPWAGALRQADFLIPLNWGCTLIEPARSLYARVAEGGGPGVHALAFACGFPLADIADAGPAVVAYADREADAAAAAHALVEAVNAREADFAGRLYAPDEAVREAVRLTRGATGPVIIADTCDNPGGGGPGDTTGMLQALLEAGVSDAVLGLLSDPAAAAAAHRVGAGRTLDLDLGEHSGLVGHTPLRVRARVLATGEGRFTATGPMYRGSPIDLGPMALLQVEGVRVAVASKPMQAADQSVLRHLGVEPSRERILVLKSSVHFRADFGPLAAHVLVAVAPGPVHADPGTLDYRRLRAGVRRRPRPAP